MWLVYQDVFELCWHVFAVTSLILDHINSEVSKNKTNLTNIVFTKYNIQLVLQHALRKRFYDGLSRCFADKHKVFIIERQTDLFIPKQEILLTDEIFK